MNYSEMQREVKVGLRDQSSDILASIPDFINEAIGQVAEENEPPALKVPFTIATLTDYAYVSTESTFSGKLLHAGISTGDLEILANLEVMMSRYPGLSESGSYPECVAVEHDKIYYQPIPTTATVIYCVGYNRPTYLVNDMDTIAWAPDFLHRDLFVFKALEIAYNLVEDGVDGRKVNTEKYERLYMIGRAKMQNWVNRRGRRVTKDRIKHSI